MAARTAMATPLTAAVRSAVIGPASRMPVARRSPDRDRSGHGWRIPRRAVCPEPANPLHAEQVPSASGARRWAGIGGRTSPTRGCTPSVGGSCAPSGRASAGHRQFGSRRRSSIAGIAARTSSGGQVAQRRQRASHELSVGGRPSALGYDSAMAAPNATQRPREPEAGARRDPCMTPWPGSRRTIGAPPPSARSPPTNGATPTSGPRSCGEQGVAVPRRSPAPAGGDSSWPSRGCSGHMPCPTLWQALEGDEEEAYDAQSSPEVASIAADERQHAEIWKRLADTAVGGRQPCRDRAASDRDGVREARRAKTTADIGRGERCIAPADRARCGPSSSA